MREGGRLMVVCGFIKELAEGPCMRHSLVPSVSF